MTKKLSRNDRGQTDFQAKEEIRKLGAMIKAHKKADKSLKLGRHMYKAFKNEVDRCTDDSAIDCGHQLLNWAKAHFWYLRIKDTMPKFDTLYDVLKKGGYTEKKPFIYGDIDKYVWAEETVDGVCKKGKTRIIIQKTMNSCADDNTHIYICRDPVKNFRTVRIGTAWKKETKNSIGNLDKPSLKTYRRTDWKVKYGDCRDEGNVLLMEPCSDKIESNFIDYKIEHALWLFHYSYDEVVTKKGKSQTWGKE